MQHTIRDCRVLTVARSWLGTPYQHQASVKGVGCDCLGLVRGVWREVIGQEPENAPPYASAWAEITTNEQLLDAARRNFQPVSNGIWKAGDLLVFRMKPRAVAKHVGIATNSDGFIHALEGASVVETPFTSFWERCVCGVFRFPDENASSAFGEQ